MGVERAGHGDRLLHGARDGRRCERGDDHRDQRRQDGQRRSHGEPGPGGVGDYQPGDGQRGGGAGGAAHGDSAGCERQPVEWADGNMGDEQCGGRHREREWAGDGWRGHVGGSWLGNHHGHDRRQECYVHRHGDDGNAASSTAARRAAGLPRS